MNIVTISSQRQITIPKQVLDRLAVSKKDRLLLNVENGQLVLRPVGKSVVEELSGSLVKHISKDKKKGSFKKIRTKTQVIVAKELAQK
jgi:AbrB family looped-hinge helix DNA binding protein